MEHTSVGAPRAPGVFITASVDTEEDNWVATRHGVTLANIRLLPAMHERVSRAGLKVTYFSAYTVVDDPGCAAILRDVHAAGGEIAGHLHPWNTPPLDEAFEPRNSMLKHLPADLQRRKIDRLTARLRDTVGVAPTAFRAGRYAIGPDAVSALVENGYRVDSSVMPWVDWSDTDGGADFTGAPLQPYRLGGSGSVTEHAPGGPLIELPMTSGYNRRPFDRWARIHTRLRTGGPVLRRLGALATRTGYLRQVVMSPEGSNLRDMLTLARLLVDQGVRHLQVVWHSPSLLPGLTPFTRDPREVDAFTRTILDWVDGIHAFTSPTFTTITETADALAPPRSADQAMRRVP